MKFIKKIFNEDLKEHILAFKEDFQWSFMIWWKYIKDTWPLFAILMIIFTGAIYFAEPSPPKEINFASGVAGGSYEQTVIEYQNFLAQFDIKVNIIPTAGPLTNLALLSGDKTELAKYLPPDQSIDVALTQSGLTSSIHDLNKIIYLGSIDFEPIFFMIRRGLEQDITSNVVESFTQLNVETGQPGTGTLAQLSRLLALDNVESINLNIEAMTDQEAVTALLADNIDGMVLVDGIESANMIKLSQSDEIKILNFPRAQAYRRRLPYLQVLTIPIGSLSLPKNIPSEDIQILSTTTALVAKSDLHPAIQYLLARASNDIAGKASFFADSREFPQFNDPKIKHSEIAREYYLKGSPYLQHYLPFWLAEIIDRLIFIILPFSALAYPILLALPKYRFKRLTRKIWANYVLLKDLELDITEHFDHDKIDDYLHRLDKIEATAVKVKIYGSMGGDYFKHRQHIHFVRSLIHRMVR
jgi:TRAP-type uncharacterized transport system substrate-binding protein